MYGASLGIFNAYVPSTAKFHPNRITQQSYDVTSIFQDGGRNLAIILPISFVVISLNQEGRNLPAYQISVRFLNPLLRYYCFQFLETNVRHVGILLRVSISSSHHHHHNTLHQPTKFYPDRTTHS